MDFKKIFRGHCVSVSRPPPQNPAAPAGRTHQCAFADNHSLITGSTFNVSTASAFSKLSLTPRRMQPDFFSILLRLLSDPSVFSQNHSATAVGGPGLHLPLPFGLPCPKRLYRNRCCRCRLHCSQEVSCVLFSDCGLRFREPRRSSQP